ncbi:transglutaminase-like domain-containing protein [Geobacter sp.]|uniref:transglutaminase-like domain-containing protein n=1 Tax=Geobacter sp. TaxID=46610 RepID=UPI00260C0A42|nr:transglutaminase-like domain-containing protein [Geobacter sp.]
MNRTPFHGALAVFLSITILAAATAVAAPSPIPRLAAPPLGVRWFAIFFDGKRTGFARQEIAAAPEGYEITAESSVRMVVLGFSRQATSRERYRVNRDLSLRSFHVEEVLDGTPLTLDGEATPRGVKVTVVSKGKRREKLLKAKGVVYPPAAMNLYPLMRGTAPGKGVKVPMLDVEEVKIKSVAIEVMGVETMPGGESTLHLRNDLYPMVDNDIWVDPAGNTLRESVRDGLVETRGVDEGSALRYLAAAAVARRDALRDFGLVPVTPPLEPATLARLVIGVEGIPAAFPLPAAAKRRDDGTVRFAVAAAEPEAAPADAETVKRYLAPADRLPVEDPAMAARAQEIVGGEKEPAKQALLLARWIAATIEEEAASDTPSPRDTLATRKGDSPARTRLYCTLARAAGIPSRLVSGLVYLPGTGFSFHSWAESAVAGKWLPVDPTFGQAPADVTHVKLVEGEGGETMMALGRLVGRIGIQVLEARSETKKGEPAAR